MSDTTRYTGDDIDRIALLSEHAVLFMRDDSVFVITYPTMDIVGYITADELTDGHKLGTWLTMVYFFLSEPVRHSGLCTPDCSCGNLTVLAESDFVTVFIN